jgi:hypothetical protein
MRDEHGKRVWTWFDRIVYGQAAFQVACFVFLAIAALFAAYFG